MKLSAIVGLAALALPTRAASADTPKPAWGDSEGALFGSETHRTALGVDMPGANGWNGRIVWTGQPGALFYPTDSIDINVQLTGVQPGEAFSLEITPIDQPFLKPDGDDLLYLPNYGVAPRGKTIVAPAAFAAPADAATGLLKLRHLPLQTCGTAVVVVKIAGRGKQPVGTIARGLVPRRNSRWLSPAMYHMGDGQLGSWDQQMAVAARAGYRWIRPDNFPNWQGSAGSGPDKPMDFSKQDKLMNAFKANGLYLISNAYGSPDWSIDPANLTAYFYAHKEEYDGAFSKWAEEAARRWCRADGEGPLQMIDYWNEPWEGGGISAWRGDAIRYRQLYSALYDGMKRGAPKIKIGGTSSIMNTGDKFFTTPELAKEWAPKFEFSTDHYVIPPMSYGPRIAERLGIMSMESETWFGGNARYVTSTLAFFLAAGQKIANTNHPAQLIWTNSPDVPLPKPSLSAMNVFLHFAGDRPFERVVFMDHLPWLFQFGKGTQAAFVLLGDGSHIVPGQFQQIHATGLIRIPNQGGRLHVYDVYGNEIAASAGTVEIPLNRDPYWIEAPGQNAALVEAAVNAAHISGIKPVELVLRDMTAVPAAGVAVAVEVRNVLNRPVTGQVALKLPGNLTLQSAVQKVALKAGERRSLDFLINAATPDPQNAYAAEASFTSPDGAAAIAETLQANVIQRGTPVIDGNLDEWAAVPTIRAVSDKAPPDAILRLWKPWEQAATAKDGVAEFKVMADDRFLYVAIRERNAAWTPTPRLSTRDDDKFFGNTPATKHTYWSPTFGTPDPGTQSVPYVGNVAQIAIGLGLGSAAHHLPEPRNVPPGIMAMPDTDYEYGVWGTPDGGTEVWRSYAAGQEWPIHFFPHTMPKGAYNGVPKDARAVVKQVGQDVIYEVALPLSDMPQFKPEMLAPGKTICLTFRLPASGVKFGIGKSATRPNGMSTMPRWELSPSNTIRWGVVAAK